MKANKHVSPSKQSRRSEQPVFASALDAFGSVPHQHSAHPHGERKDQPSFAAAFDLF